MDGVRGRHGGRGIAAFVAAIGFGLLAIGIPATARGGDDSRWEFEVAPYMWVPGNSGTLTVDGRSAAIDVGVGDVLRLTFQGDAFAAAGHASVRYDRLSLFVDAFGGYAEQSVTERVPTQLCSLDVQSRMEMHFVILDAAVGWRLGAWRLPERRRPITLGVYAGTRYMHFGVDLDAKAGVAGAAQRAAAASDTFGWFDPMIGVRWEVPVLDRLSLDFRSDIGGFGASSDLIWGLATGVRWWVPYTRWGIEPWLGAGYRSVWFDRSSSEEDLSLAFRGPTMGVGLVY